MPDISEATKQTVSFVTLVILLVLPGSSSATTDQFVYQTYETVFRNDIARLANVPTVINTTSSPLEIGTQVKLTYTLQANQKTSVFTSGMEGDVDLDLFAYTEDNQLLASSTNAMGEEEAMYFVPSLSANYTILLVNDAEQSMDSQNSQDLWLFVEQEIQHRSTSVEMTGKNLTSGYYPQSLVLLRYDGDFGGITINVSDGLVLNQTRLYARSPQNSLIYYGPYEEYIEEYQKDTSFAYGANKHVERTQYPRYVWSGEDEFVVGPEMYLDPLPSINYILLNGGTQYFDNDLLQNYYFRQQQGIRDYYHVLILIAESGEGTVNITFQALPDSETDTTIQSSTSIDQQEEPAISTNLSNAGTVTELLAAGLLAFMVLYRRRRGG